MALSVRTFSQLVQDMSATIQGSAVRLLDLSVGSVLRSILEANASVALWMQWLILRVLQSTRAATSSGADLDSWMNDFGVNRLPARAATGMVTFSRLATQMPATIPAGTRVRTRDATQTFSVVEDSLHACWVPASRAYALAAGMPSITVPVEATTAGASGNVTEGSISLIASSLPGIDAVLNQASLSNGSDPETDTALRARFHNYMLSRSRATPASIAYAISSIQQGLNFVIDENADASGAYRLGSFVVTLDDGTGSPTPSLLAFVASAVDAVRPIGTVFSVRPPDVIRVDVSLHVSGRSGTPTDQTRVDVARSVSDYVNGLPIGMPLSVTRIAQVAYEASDAVANVYGISINGQAVDFATPHRGVLKAGPVIVSA